MKYRDPKTGNLELFPILKSIDHTELIKSVLTECNKIFEDYSIEPIDSLEKLPEQIKKIHPKDIIYSEDILLGKNIKYQNIAEKHETPSDKIKFSIISSGKHINIEYLITAEKHEIPSDKINHFNIIIK